MNASLYMQLSLSTSAGKPSWGVCIYFVKTIQFSCVVIWRHFVQFELNVTCDVSCFVALSCRWHSIDASSLACPKEAILWHVCRASQGLSSPTSAIFCRLSAFFGGRPRRHTIVMARVRCSPSYLTWTVPYRPWPSLASSAIWIRWRVWRTTFSRRIGDGVMNVS